MVEGSPAGRLVALVVMLAAAFSAPACGVEQRIQEDELARIDPPAGLRHLADGDEERFVYRLYTTGSKRVSLSGFEPPSDDYERTRTPKTEVWPGWKPLATWVGPTPDRKRECALAFELATDLESIQAVLDEDQEESLGDEQVVRVRVSCHLPQHSFD